MVEIRRLRALKDSPKAIALKLGMERSYISGIINLVEHGEQDLIGRVEAGRLPLDAAIAIANGKDADIQNALCEAYDNGTLRGKRLEAIRCLLRQRKGESPPLEQGRVTSADLVKAYQQNTEQQRALMRRSIVVTERLAILSSSMRRLLADDHFLTLLRAEGLRTMPEFFNTRIAAEVEGNGCL
jgi:ParB family chromosome partitioning protein